MDHIIYAVLILACFISAFAAHARVDALETKIKEMESK